MNEAAAIGALSYPPPTLPALIVGVDGGGTKTHALLATYEGTILGSGFGGPSNYQKTGFREAIHQIQFAVNAAFADARVPLRQPVAIALGLAGVDRTEDLQRFQQWAQQTWPHAKTTVVNDAELVLPAGTPAGWGIGVICGTGATTVGRSRNGDFARADGWGHLLGDDGSGYWIGLQALRAILRAVDGRGPVTALEAEVLATWSLPTPDAILTRVYIDNASPAEIASLAAIVTRVAEAGDRVASEIVQRGAQEIATTIEAVVNRLGLHGQVPIGLAGGVLTSSTLMQRATIAAAADRKIELAPIALVNEPVLGAIRLAQSSYA